MRLVHLMSFVCAMLLLATIPACMQFARLSGMHPAASLATVGAILVVALAAMKRV